MAWHEEQASHRVAEEFLNELEATVETIVRHPRLGQRRGRRGNRGLRLIRFPYTVIYRLGEDALRIVAVANQKRRPGYWAGRR